VWWPEGSGAAKPLEAYEAQLLMAAGDVSRVRAAPTDGEANSALLRLFAQTLRIAPREIALVGRATSRIKRMLIRGDVNAVVAALERIGETLK